MREAGYAINDGETEAGVVVVRASMQDTAGRPIVALTIAVPRDRWHTQGSDQTIPHCRTQGTPVNAPSKPQYGPKRAG